MNTRRFSLMLAGLLWLLVALRIGSRSINWLEPYFAEPNWMLLLIPVSLFVGYMKASKMLAKSIKRSVDNLDKIDDQFINYFIGWLKLMGIKGFLIISLMIGLGFGLRHLKTIGFDPYNLYGFVYLAVAFALLYGSSFYFKEAKKN